MAQVDRTHLPNGHNVHCRMPRDDPRSLPDYASAIDKILRWNFDYVTRGGTFPDATLAGALQRHAFIETLPAGQSSTGLYHHHNQEERESTPVCRLDRSSSLEASLALRTDLEHQGNVETNTNPRSQNASPSSSSSRIESFDDADILAACILMEMSNNEMNVAEIRSSDTSDIADEGVKEQLVPTVRVSDFDDRAASPSRSPPASELSEMVGTIYSSPEATDEEVGTVQETRAPRAEDSSGTSRPRIEEELRTLGKKRVKPRKDEQELNVGENQEESAATKNEIRDRPTKKRHYKSLHELLGIK
jgi:hypothetical protein